MCVLSEAIHLFIESLNNLDNDTKRAYHLDLNKFLISQDDIQINQVSRQSLIQYLDHLSTKDGKRASVSTQNRHYATLKRFFTWLIKEEHLAKNPFHNIERRKANKDLGEIPTGSIIRALNNDQVQRILKRLKKEELREQVLFLLIYTTGLRVSEALSIRSADLQLSQDSVLIREAKGNKPRTTFISKTVKPLLKRYLKEVSEEYAGSPWLFPSPSSPGQALSYGRARQLFIKLTKDINNPDGSKVTIHQLRHTFATERAGYIDSILLMNLMGHSDIRTTLRYAKATTKATKQAFEQFEAGHHY